jgi:zinc/manganese transport system permease protein
VPSHDVLLLLAPPFGACVLFVAIHGAFGQHVLRRGVVFVDLALAQMSALGSTVAFAAGHDPMGMSGLAYTLLFSTVGALLLTLSRAVRSGIQAEAHIGVLYVFATAATVVVVDRSPQGAEHVKQMLTGTVLAVSGGELPKLATLYGIIGLVLWAARTPLERASDPAPGPGPRGRLAWDFVFYAAFGVVVTSSVAIAGVLLVFCYLIVPSVGAMLWASRIGSRLAIGWVMGVVVSILGMYFSVWFDLPTGATIVCTFGLILVLMALARPVVVRR